MTDGQTDGRTDVQPIAITCVTSLTHVKNITRRMAIVRQFLQSTRHIIWLPHESNAGMSLPSAELRVEVFGYVKRL